MKKLSLLSVLALVAISFSSCKKDYTCNCVDEDGDKWTVIYKGVSKSTAKKNCVDKVYKSTTGGSDGTATCDLFK